MVAKNFAPMGLRRLFAIAVQSPAFLNATALNARVAKVTKPN